MRLGKQVGGFHARPFWGGRFEICPQATNILQEFQTHLHSTLAGQTV